MFLLVVALAGLAEPFLSGAPAVRTVDRRGEQVATEPDLSGTVWQWQETLMNDDGTYMPDNPADYTVRFVEDGTVTVQADCNRVRGSFTIDENVIAIALGPSTMAVCPDGSLGDRFSAQLAGAAIFFFRSGDLYLDLKYDSGTMRFEPQSDELAGTSWIVIGHNNGRGGVVSSIIDTEMTIMFGGDGNVSGSAGCNRYTAQYRIAGDGISVGLPMTTRQFCAEPEGLMDQEQAYLTALATAVTYFRTGDRMEMRTAEGSIVATFEAANR